MDSEGLSGGADILIVDNDERIAELVAWFLQKRGHRVRTAGSFGEVRAALAERRPDLLLSDIDLGAESALEELPRLASGGALPPTLVVSGYLDADAVAKLGRVAPVLGTLAKPFDFAVLERRVLECLAQTGRGDAAPATPPAAAPHPVDEPGGDEEGWVEITPAPRAAPAPRPRRVDAP